MKRFYTVKEVSKLLGFSTNTVYKYLDEGKIVSTRLGEEGRFRISAAEVSKLLPDAGTQVIGEEIKPVVSASILSKIASAPSLFDWFTFILAISLGVSQFLFPTYILDVNYQKYALIIKFLKGGLILFGSLLIFDDIFGRKKKLLHDAIHIALALCFLSISLVFFQTDYFPQLIGYLSVALSLVILRFWKVDEYVKYLLLVNFNLFFFGLGAVAFPSKSGLVFLSSWVAQNKFAFLAIWILMLFASLYLSFLASKGKKSVIFLISGAVSILAIMYSIFAFSFGFWERAVYLIVLSAFSFLFPFWRSFQVFTSESRQQLLLAFFWLNALFAIGGVTLFFLGRSFESYLLSEMEKRLAAASEITESFVTNAQENIATYSQDRQLISLIEEGEPSGSDMEELLKDFFMTEKGGFRRIVFSNADGINVNLYPELPESIGLDISGIESFKLAKEGRRVVTSGVTKPRVSGVSPAILIMSPIYSLSGEFLGVLGGSLDLVELSKRLSQVKFASQGGFKVIDGNKNFIIHPNQEKVLTKAEEGSPAWLSVDGGKGVKKAYDSDNVLSLMVYKPLSTLGWGIVAIQPLAESFSQYSVLGFVVFAVLILAGIGSLILIIKSKNTKVT